MVGWSMSAKRNDEHTHKCDDWTWNRRIFGLETRNGWKTRGDLRLLSVHPRYSDCMLAFCGGASSAEPLVEVSAKGEQLLQAFNNIEISTIFYLLIEFWIIQYEINS